MCESRKSVREQYSGRLTDDGNDDKDGDDGDLDPVQDDIDEREGLEEVKRADGGDRAVAVNAAARAINIASGGEGDRRRARKRSANRVVSACPADNDARPHRTRLHRARRISLRLPHGEHGVHRGRNEVGVVHGGDDRAEELDGTDDGRHNRGDGFHPLGVFRVRFHDLADDVCLDNNDVDEHRKAVHEKSNPYSGSGADGQKPYERQSIAICGNCVRCIALRVSWNDTRFDADELYRPRVGKQIRVVLVRDSHYVGAFSFRDPRDNLRVDRAVIRVLAGDQRAEVVAASNAAKFDIDDAEMSRDEVCCARGV